MWKVEYCFFLGWWEDCTPAGSFSFWHSRCLRGRFQQWQLTEQTSQYSGLMIAKSWCSSVTHFSPSSLPSPWKLLFVFPIFVSAYWTRVPARDSDEPLVESNACGWNFLTIPNGHTGPLFYLEADGSMSNKPRKWQDSCKKKGRWEYSVPVPVFRGNQLADD